MKQIKILNIIIAGTGGQGVITLSDLIRKLAVNAGYKCEGATFKGGAQRMGSVHTELRILQKQKAETVFSSQIPMGEVDVLISTEPWEALRFAGRCHKKTKVLANAHEEKLYTERFQNTELLIPSKKLKELFEDLTLLDYSALAKAETGSTKNINILMLLDAISKSIIPFTMEELDAVIE
jgi:indolepyruvate ferredoxin oxidoreductase beta subunit